MSHTEMNTHYEAPKKEFRKKPSSHSSGKKTGGKSGPPANSHWANKAKKSDGGGKKFWGKKS